ncbi:hypothetical protein E6R18_25230 [Streptomyces sp. A1277]|nr:hypothetical protein E6R18_25230 [Streptomyces sp. A1277]
MVGGVVITVVVGLILLANAASSDENEPDDTDYPDDSTPVAEEPSRQYVTQGVNVLYTRCSHSGCQKKMDPRIIGHDCCGRCQTSKVRDCQEAADRAYQGPGGFRHNYFEGALFPGVCTACGEPPEGHWVLDGAATRPL